MAAGRRHLGMLFLLMWAGRGIRARFRR